MLKTLFQRKPKASPLDQARVPEGLRIYAIGDVHGRLDLLDDLLNRIEHDKRMLPDNDVHLVFLGDLIDRGPDSCGVIDRAIELRDRWGTRVHFLMGNHEEVFLGAATGDEKLVRFFCRIGGRETILSYDITLEDYQQLHIEELAAQVPKLIPQDHVDFVSSFKDRLVFGDYAFVHAGIRPGTSIADQNIKDLRWIREDFILDNEPHEKVIVHGHTITEQVEECRNRIGIDTGAYMSGILTALVLEGNQRRYLQTGVMERQPSMA